jgi:hypothetical protein
MAKEIELETLSSNPSTEKKKGNRLLSFALKWVCQCSDGRALHICQGYPEKQPN